MSSADRDAALRGAVRELLGELLPRTNGSGAHADTGNADAIIPAVPAPPVAAVLRPSTWSAPAAPGEVIGERDARDEPARPGAATLAAEPVRIDDDVDLNGFARALSERLQDPGTRDAIRAGRLRFSLQRSGAAAAQAAGEAQAPAAPAQSRTVTGPVTERTIRTAAADGARLVLGRGAVLTPLARDTARSLGVTIEKERGC
ncbi:MAG: hypothetical protein ACRDMJ_08685 [Solirubrobacteraceae bacterium]